MSPCLVCRSESGFSLFHDSSPRVVRCDACGFAFQPSETREAVDYEGVFDLSFAETTRFRYPEERLLHVDIARRISKLRPGRPVVDVGCGDGQFIDVCSQMGIDVVGLEPSVKLAEYAQRVTGRRVVRGFYESGSFAPSSLAVVTLLQVLEHVADPRAVLLTAYQHLEPEGLLVVDVPSLNSKRLLAYRLTKDPRYLDHERDVIPSHLWYFSPATLRRLLVDCGFTVDRVVAGRRGIDGSLRGRVADVVLNACGVGGLLVFATRRGDK